MTLVLETTFTRPRNLNSKSSGFFDQSYEEVVIALLKQHSGTVGLVAQLNHLKLEWSLECTCHLL